jgi:CDP-glycerol glycerophosphotransferase (TagB/SpsB family)
MAKSPNRLVRLTIALVLYPVARLWPRRQDHWVFGSGGDQFAGNPRVLFLWMQLYRPQIRATWITADRELHDLLSKNGLAVAMRWSLAGIRAALAAGVYAFSHDPADVNAPLSRGARHVNLWHGVGLKALHVGARPAGKFQRWLRSFVYIPYDLVVSTSDMMQAHFAKQFHLPQERCPQLGYPRLDSATMPELDALNRDIDRHAGFQFNPANQREVYLYAPTFRDTGRPFLADALPDLDRLEEILRQRDALLYIKLHPRSTDPVPTDRASIRPWPHKIDMQTYLADLTGLITDYSSILYDYLANKDDGVLLYVFDLADYLAHDRSLLYPFDDHVAGVRVETFDRLCKAISSGESLGQRLPGIDKVRATFWGGSPRPSSPAILAALQGRSAHAQPTQGRRL